MSRKFLELFGRKMLKFNFAGKWNLEIMNVDL